MKPVSAFFLANLIYFLFPLINTFTTNLSIQMEAFSYSPLAKEWVMETIQERNITLEEYASVYNLKTTELSKLLIVIMASMVGLLMWPIHIGSKHHLLADHITLGQEVVTFILIACLQGMGVLFVLLSPLGLNLFSDAVLTTVSCMLLLYFFARAEKTFYGFKGVRLVINSILDLTAVIISLSLYRALLFFITFWSI